MHTKIIINVGLGRRMTPRMYRMLYAAYVRIRGNYYVQELLSYLYILVPYKNVAYFESSYNRIKSVALEGRIPVPFRILYTIYSYEIVKLIYFDVIPSSVVEKLIFFDYFNLIGLPDNFNVAFVFVFVQFAYSLRLCFFRAYQREALELAYQVLVRKNVRQVLLSSHIRFGRYSIYSVAKKFFLFIVNFWQLNAISLSKLY